MKKLLFLFSLLLIITVSTLVYGRVIVNPADVNLMHSGATATSVYNGYGVKLEGGVWDTTLICDTVNSNILSGDWPTLVELIFNYKGVSSTDTHFDSTMCSDNVALQFTVSTGIDADMSISRVVLDTPLAPTSVMLDTLINCYLNGDSLWPYMQIRTILADTLYADSLDTFYTATTDTRIKYTIDCWLLR